MLQHFAGYKIALVFMTVMSFIFYGKFSLQFAAILLLSSLVTYGLSWVFLLCERRDKKLSKEAAMSVAEAADGSRSPYRKWILAAALIFELGLLFLYKYLDFFADIMHSVFGVSMPVANLLMPVGISFITFGQLSFLIDRYRGEAEHYGFLEYMTFASFFPKLIEGPIAFHKEIIDQLRDPEKRVFDTERFVRGASLFIIGLSKKVLLADLLAGPADYGFYYTYYMDTLTGILVLLAYTFEIYFDFSGYCDMAAGISLMLGITLPTNFNSPYKAATLKELWQRWHMTLSRFFIKYVYIPMGGSRKGKVRTVCNVLLVFLLSGLWHGAGWTYIAWGLMQGLLVVWDDLGIVGVKPRKMHAVAAGVHSQDESVQGKAVVSADRVEEAVKDTADISQKRTVAKVAQKKAPRYLLREKPFLMVPHFVGQIFTFTMFVISLIFFRSQDMTYAFQYFKQLTVFTLPGFLYQTAGQLSISEFYVVGQAVNQIAPAMANTYNLVVFVLLLVVCFFVISRPNAQEIALQGQLTKRKALGLGVLFIWAFLSLSGVSTFIYFQF